MNHAASNGLRGVNILIKIKEAERGEKFDAI